MVESVGSLAGSVVDKLNHAKSTVGSALDDAPPAAADRRHAWKDPAALKGEARAVAENIAAVERAFNRSR